LARSFYFAAVKQVNWVLIGVIRVVKMGGGVEYVD